QAEGNGLHAAQPPQTLGVGLGLRCDQRNRHGPLILSERRRGTSRRGGSMPPMTRPTHRTVITFGTFDVFHVGHLRVIERAASLGDRLVVGVSADALNERKKGRVPVFTERERIAIVAALKPVDEVFVEESLELKRHYITQHAA